MRNAALVLATALLIPSVSAAPVTLKRPHIVYRSPAGVASACKGDKLACTTVEADFYCTCEQSQGSWVLAPRIIATPTVYSTSDAELRHELSHLADIHKSLNEYAAGLLLRSFPSDTTCNAFVSSEAKAFAPMMKAVQRATTIKRDGIQFAGPAE